jgi:hypothetical protein
MPSEAQVLELVRATMPKGTLIRGVVEYGWGGSTDCPLAFLLHAGIQLAGMGLDERVYIYVGTTIKANFNSFLVGPTSSRKTTAIRLVADLTKVATSLGSKSNDGDDTTAIGMADLSDHVLIDAASREGLIRLLGERGKRVVLIPEGGDWLSLSHGSNYQATMRGIFTRMYDGDEIRHETKDIKKALKPVTNHCASVIMGATASHLEEYTSRPDWEGGFMNRFLFIDADRERDYDHPKKDKAAFADLAMLLAKRAAFQAEDERREEPFQIGGWEPGALDLWLQWSKGRNAHFKTMSGRKQTAIARWQTHAAKLLLIASTDLQANYEQDWKIPLAAVRFATAVADWGIADALSLYERIAGSLYEERRNGVIDVMRNAETQGQPAIRLEQIARELKPMLNHRDLQLVLDSMISERTLYVWPEDDENERPPMSLRPPHEAPAPAPAKAAAPAPAKKPAPTKTRTVAWVDLDDDDDLLIL